LPVKDLRACGIGHALVDHPKSPAS
jgi:hypothetical protein